MSSEHVILNINVLDIGIHVAAWQNSGLPPTAFVDPGYFADMARLAEHGTLDALFLADGPALRDDPRLKPSRALEPSAILSAVAAETTHLGVIGTLSTTFNDPVELAHRLLTLDHLSEGRAAWNVVTTYSPQAGHNFGLADYPERSVRYRRASEFVDVVLALWRSAASREPVSHHGEFFDVDGLLPLGASPQGHPLIVQAGGSPQGRELAARSANAVFSAELTLDAGRHHYRQVKDDAGRLGRSPDDVAILPGLITVLAKTREEAHRRFEYLESFLPEFYSLDRLSTVLAYDLRGLDLDDRVPDEALADISPDAFTASMGFRESIVRSIRDSRATVREAVRQFSGGGHRIAVGSPEDIADTIEEWFRAGAADGFNLMPDVFPSGLEDFVDHVVPILRDRGLFRREYAETTLRERFSSVNSLDRAG
ncbi:NtaA/DmoA family FMN-dependent monooxygenase [Rhodococcoides kyotonense]|uniref:FMN-dependent oxidoreductase, nitrilotriacetate monooxygenase family n=1 Tax=Rhodococcoides kyotonense TaxID=398843 RepID=A0A239G9S1_9NOCA|nr:NtaA/DmoA family FMN-dependent monooxygenase [Rhodococcus kyotonensis]SNS65538.1 FMN-dependent oxidoreductase, nitrilotriacetate monooxygenase family [Rhodococcus kyotonensis]